MEMDHMMSPAAVQIGNQLEDSQKPFKLSVGESSAVKQDEATDQRNEDVQNVESSRVGHQDMITIPTSLAISRHMPPFSKPPVFLAPASEFPQFSKLPAELRLMIWKEALPRPRLVEVKFQFEDDDFPFATELLSCATRTPPPAMLATCHESRMEALNHYSLCFALKDGEANITFDLKDDILLLSCDNLVEILSSLNCVGGLEVASFQGLRHLAIGLCSDNINIDPVDLRFLVEDLTSLETFTLVLHEKHNCRSDWQNATLWEVAVENEPIGFKDKFNQVMTNQSLWMPGRWREAPTLKFMELNRRWT